MAGPARVLLPLPAETSVRDGQKVVWGVRPEHLDLAGPTGGGIVEAAVDVVEPTGADTMIVASLAGEPITIVTDERVAYGRGTALRLAPQLDRIHLFDPATGARI
jgi:multiple sugar transport system ATP-binding protein